MVRISVCIASYNGEKYIKAQLSSILSQLSENDEVIISDDSSSDGTLRVIREIGDPRIILIENGKFRSPIYNLENALKQSKGEYIFLADQDDIWTSDKVAVMMRYLSEYDMVVSDCKVVDEHLNVVEESFYVVNGSRRGIINNLRRNAYLGCCMAFTRKVCDVALPFPRQLPMHDIWLGFIAEVAFPVKFIDDKLVLYRRHGDNASPTAGTSPYSFMEKMAFRWNIVRHFFEIRRKKARADSKQTY